MAIWENLLAGGIGELAKGVGSLAKDIRTAITGTEPLSAEQRARLEEQLNAMEAAAHKAAADYDIAQMQGQVDLNKIEAQSDSLYKSGWRPAVGWICVAGLGVTFILKPLLPWLVDVSGLLLAPVMGAAGYVPQRIPAIPEIPMSDLLILLGGMLGLGTMRSVEKIKGATRP